MPLIVTVLPVELLKVSPAGNPGAVQPYGAVPPEAVHVAEYATPTCVGPAVGVQFSARPEGKIVPL